MYSAPRSASIQAQTECKMWAIDGVTFRQIVESMKKAEFTENRKFIGCVGFFKTFTEQQCDELAMSFSNQSFSKGQTIVRKGESADSF